MKKLNPIERSKYINDEYKDYLRSSFEFGKSDLQKLFNEQLEKEKLFKGPYVDMSFPFVKGKSIDQLIDENIVSKSFHKLGDVNFKRPLYSHQEKAIKHIKGGRSAIVTTGTGSGKTESFLYPILNDLMYEIEEGNNEVGIRAIFLYPMNALVNDQMDRLRKILKGCPEIKFGFFTGDTPENAPQNARIELGNKNNTIITDNELISRKEIRETPPHLLFTNYSMLEYLLIRPNDYSIFEPERLNNWRYVVLDEAHSYSGSLGIELSLLLRRLTGLANTRPKFILTSATLGEQGKSEKDIVHFAKSLTSVDFNESDIIFADRIALKDIGNIEYKIKGSDYIDIKNVKDSIEKIKEVTDKYFDCDSTNAREYLYELLCRDENVHTLSEILETGSKDFYDIQHEMNDNLSTEELIALIDVVNSAEKDGVSLFDLKYHSFVRPLSGAYITRGDNPKLSLTKTSEIDGMKAFEIGNCRFCNSTYIIGKIQKNKENNLDYLLQNKEIDIYENYGNEEFVRLDYFVVDNEIDDEIIQDETVIPYEVCSKCGELHEKDNLNAKKCKCNDKYRFLAYKVIPKSKKDEELIYNNITFCPCCGNGRRSGVIKGLNIGKDEGTAIIAQLLFDAVDEEDTDIKITEKRSLKSLMKAKKEKEDKENKEIKCKQFLAFSDSRQQASFFAVFFNSNHERMLRKRLIWEIIKENNYNKLSVNKLVSYIEDKINHNHLFANSMNSEKNAWAAVLIDLLKVDGSFDGEGLGLYHFELDIMSYLEEIEEDDIVDSFKEYGINKMSRRDLYNLLQIITDVFKKAPAINYAESTLSKEEKRDNLEYRRFNNYVILKNPKKSKSDNSDLDTKGIRSLLPAVGKENMIIRYVMRAFGINSEQAKKVIEGIFELLIELGSEENCDYIVKRDNKDAYQIKAKQFIVNNYKNSNYYICDKCKKLTPYNINNACVQEKCDGKLSLIDPDIILESNHYRKKYKNKKIERIVVKEHTAQIERKHAKKYQDDFRDKKINILSCSTTFEMGIDIGGLENVFMRNVPPTPANYVQRAGRAGRRKDSPAYILTYCGVGSHDYTYFSEPEKMISGIINPPYFNVENKKIIVRHLMTTTLGFFFRENPDYFKNLEVFIFNGGVEKYKEYISSHPNDLNEYINNKVLPEIKYDGYKNFNWLDEMDNQDEKMEYFIDSVKDTLNEYEIAISEARKKIDEGDLKAGEDLSYYMKQRDILLKERLLDNLSKYCVIPKYGFPVDVVDLQIYKNGIIDKKYDLSRDLKIAISEYAPDSEVIVDGNKYTSKYITFRKNKPFSRNYFVTCPECKRINLSLIKKTEAKCSYCGNSIGSQLSEYYIEPKYGFKTGETKESTRMKPKRSYSGEVIYVGNGKIDEQRMDISDDIGIETSSDDELLIINKSRFYMCPVCGYSEIINNNSIAPKKTIKHQNFKNFDCINDELEIIRLGHRFKTDVARFTIPSLNSKEKVSHPKALSFMYAFLEGISSALGIERNDIDGVLELNSERDSYDVLIYDNVPGGAGHIKRLLSKDAIINSLRTALARVSKNCCDENTSCYNCLRNYYNQSYHTKLQRKLAIEVINQLLFELESTFNS